MTHDTIHDLDALFASRLARIPVPARRTRPVRRHDARALVAAAAAGIVIASSITVFDAAATAESQGAGCADLVTKLQLYLGTATTVKTVTPGAPKSSPLPDAKAAVPGDKPVPNDETTSKASGDATQLMKASATPIMTCVVGGQTITIYKTGDALRLSR